MSSTQENGRKTCSMSVSLELTECSKLNLKQRSMSNSICSIMKEPLCASFERSVTSKIETGRFIGEALNKRLRRSCNTDADEDEKHFLFECALYNNLRTTYSADISIMTIVVLLTISLCAQ